MKLMMRFLKDNEVFNKTKDEEKGLECEKLLNMNYGKNGSYAGVYRIKYKIKKTEYVDFPFEYEGDYYEIIEVPDDTD